MLECGRDMADLRGEYPTPRGTKMQKKGRLFLAGEEEVTSVVTLKGTTGTLSIKDRTVAFRASGAV